MKKITRKIVLIIAIAVFALSCYKLYSIYAEYKAGEKEYEELIKDVISEEVVQNPNQGDENQEEGNQEEGNSGEGEGQGQGSSPSEGAGSGTTGSTQTTPPKIEPEVIFRVDFNKLFSINKDTVGWIRFKNPSIISYPVVRAEDNDKYLKTTFEGKKNSAGTIFMDTTNRGDFSDRNTFIYGHNMKNGTMFGQLRKYKSESFYRANPYFYIYTPDGKEHTYQIFSVAIVDETSDSYQRMYANSMEFEEYLQKIKARSRYNTGVEVNKDSKIITLSTCTNVTPTQRLLIHAVKISEKVVGE